DRASAGQEGQPLGDLGGGGEGGLFGQDGRLPRWGKPIEEEREGATDGPLPARVLAGKDRPQGGFVDEGTPVQHGFPCRSGETGCTGSGRPASSGCAARCSSRPRSRP